MKKSPVITSLLFSAILLGISGCEPANTTWKAEAENPEFLHSSLQKITDVIVHDIFSPPVAGRIYAYSTIAAYEAMVPGHPDYISLQGQVTDLKDVPQPEAGKEYCYSLAGVKAMLEVGKKLISSEQTIEEFEAGLMEKYKSLKIPKAVFERSIAYGQAVGDHINTWADGDNYKQTRTFPKYTVTDDPSQWKPTPPDYLDAIEPHWNKIRPFSLDSASQFAPVPPIPFNVSDKNSAFYKEAMDVYEVINSDKSEIEERTAIAKFWDCNPYVSHHKGHVMFATKKITPGGHWMGITQTACKKANADIMLSAKAYALAAIALEDGFISSWDEKFRSNLVRPVTVINNYIDRDWQPLLQTPPFPEYTSAHSVISASAATALTSIFGENFSYTDSVEVQFGMPPRTFNSFMEASKEAAISRLYGGIHYRPACMIGVEQGKKVGQHLLEKIKMNKQ